MRRLRWLVWCVNLVLVLALVGEAAHAHAAGDAAHPCAVCAVGGAPAVATPAQSGPEAPQPAEPVTAERPAPRPAARATAVHASRAPPRAR